MIVYLPQHKSFLAFHSHSHSHHNSSFSVPILIAPQEPFSFVKYEPDAPMPVHHCAHRREKADDFGEIAECESPVIGAFISCKKSVFCSDAPSLHNSLSDASFHFISFQTAFLSSRCPRNSTNQESVCKFLRSVRI
jgi:hypothetical protein